MYILFNAQHSLNKYDVRMLAHLFDIRKRIASTRPRSAAPFTLQPIITKADRVPESQISDVISRLRLTIQEDVEALNMHGRHDEAGLCVHHPPIVTSAKLSIPFGVDEVRSSIIEACGLG